MTAKPEPEWVSLGTEGRDHLRDQLNALMNLSVVAVNENGEQRVQFQWAVDLAGLLLPRVPDGQVYAGVPSGLDRTLVLEREVVEQDANDLVRERFLGSGSSQFCVILSDYLYASELREKPKILPNSDQLRIVVHNEGVYGIIKLPVSPDDRCTVFESVIGLVNGGAFLIAVAGDGQFAAVGERLWNSSEATREDLQRIERSTSRILTTGVGCGQYLVWDTVRLDGS